MLGPGPGPGTRDPGRDPGQWGGTRASGTRASEPMRDNSKGNTRFSTKTDVGAKTIVFAAHSPPTL